ncbi:ribonuclease H family protein [Clostridium chromiireducens]|uniref:ribonuclease H n=1 Tax=Clostridium chromiireducens TaxID=225345 RepID=A0A1V4ILW4_9CLOT|nr:ribonuclease H [Clostridium chromiireducens]OPJ60834.1 ribonuclease HI [Clostridium chromiireducens]RII33211.1 ribonuclease HI [Clostridium chromiireducens]
MKMMLFSMEIIDEENNNYKIKISNGIDNSFVEFNPLKKELHFIDNNNLSDFFKGQEYQFRKMLHNKRIDTYYVGFKVKVVIREDKDVAAFNDRSKILVLDKRNNNYDSYAIDENKAEARIHKIYTDASYFEKKNHGGFAFIIEDLTGNYNLYTDKVKDIGSSQAELEAAIKALELLKDIKKIRIITDSQYVRKGLTEWLPIWKLNDFKTINGESAKNIDKWLNFDKVCGEKYIEFQWVKAHSNHFENSLCDMYARDTAKSFKGKM